MIHHGDQKVQEYDDVDDRVGSEHQHSPEPGEALDASQLKVVQIDEAKHSPEQCLSRLKQTVNRHHVLLITVHLALQCKLLLTCVQIKGAVREYANNLMFMSFMYA